MIRVKTKGTGSFANAAIRSSLPQTTTGLSTVSLETRSSLATLASESPAIPAQQGNIVFRDNLWTGAAHLGLPPATMSLLAGTGGQVGGLAGAHFGTPLPTPQLEKKDGQMPASDTLASINTGMANNALREQNINSVLLYLVAQQAQQECLRRASFEMQQIQGLPASSFLDKLK